MATTNGSTTDRVPRILSRRIGPDWADLYPHQEASQDRQRIISEIILSPHLILICGLGTSVYVKEEGGVSIAPTMANLWTEVSSHPDFAQILEQISFSPKQPNIERLLSQCQLWQAMSPSAQMANFIREAEQAIVKRCRFVSSTVALDKHEIFLRKVARRSTRLPRMKLFTTNYDRCFETAASRMGFIVVDGFSHTLPQEFDGANFDYDLVRRSDDREGPEYLPNVFHLYKMHGSVDWGLVEGRITRSDQPDRPLIIYPRNTKFESSYNPPFIEMMARLQLYLREPNTGLLIMGFGFNDEHISQPILAAIRSNVGIKAAIIDPFISDVATTNPHVGAIEHLIKGGDDRLTLVETSFEECAQSLPDLVAITEEEQHRRRLSALDRRS